ncbi:hypothetical protein K9N08_01005 [Candidatus Gracilibacteria bacterium]|nr:hypothetical protein [Candidatus Gracilibacteria bacterium]
MKNENEKVFGDMVKIQINTFEALAKPKIEKKSNGEINSFSSGRGEKILSSNSDIEISPSENDAQVIKHKGKSYIFPNGSNEARSFGFEWGSTDVADFAFQYPNGISLVVIGKKFYYFEKGQNDKPVEFKINDKTVSGIEGEQPKFMTIEGRNCLAIDVGGGKSSLYEIGYKEPLLLVQEISLLKLQFKAKSGTKFDEILPSGDGLTVSNKGEKPFYAKINIRLRNKK